jgi:hypothetical protein
MIKRVTDKTRQKYNDLFESFQLLGYHDGWKWQRYTH